MRKYLLITLFLSAPVSVGRADELTAVDIDGVTGDTKAATSRLTLDDAVATALGNHPQLQAAAAAVRSQQHLVYQVTRKLNPTFGYAAAEVGNEGQAGQQGVFLYQDFVRGNKLNLNGQVQQRAVLIAQHELEVQRRQISADVRLEFIDVAVAQERLKVLHRLQLSLDRAVTSVQRLVDSGEVSLSSSLQSKLEAQRNQMKIGQTQTQLAAAQGRLAALLGWESLAMEVETKELLPETAVPTFDELWPQLSSSSPEVLLANCRYARSQWQVRREIAEPIPNLQTQWLLQQDASTKNTVVGIQLGWELPIINNNSGAINAARATTWQTHYEIEALQRSLRQRLVFTLGQLQQADQQLKIIKEQLESLARENLQRTQQAFSLGEAGYLDLLNAQRAYISLSLETLQLYRQHAVAEAHLATSLVRVPRSTTE